MKLVFPLVAAGGLVHGLLVPFSPVLTNLDGSGPLFSSGASYLPGAAPEVRTAHVRLDGSGAAAAPGFFVTGYAPRLPASAPSCTATDPGDRFQVTVAEAGTTLFRASLASLAAEHGTAPTRVGLGSWRPGQVREFTISVGLDAAAGNSYMGCVLTAGLAWYAAQ